MASVNCASRCKVPVAHTFCLMSLSLISDSPRGQSCFINCSKLTTYIPMTYVLLWLVITLDIFSSKPRATAYQLGPNPSSIKNQIARLEGSSRNWHIWPSDGVI